MYLAAVLAAHSQKGLPAFGIYGRDVQDLGDSTIPDDVQEKILRFAKALSLIHILCEGKVTGEIDISEATQESIMTYAVYR